jgi:DNA-directed RNA polymerase subunit RPC12/RpoP
MEIKNKILVVLIGVVDLLIGLTMIVLPRFFPLFIAGYHDYAALSDAMLVSFAYPCLILLTGLGLLLKREWARVLGFFAALLAMASAFTEFFSTKIRPEFASTSPDVHFIFSLIVPGLAIAYFAFHSLVLLIFTRPESAFWGAREKEPETKSTVLEEMEYFCATCKKPVSPQDEACPACGAILKGYRCAQCQYEDVESKFKDDRCPRCGAVVEKD